MKKRSSLIRPSGEVLPFMLRKKYNDLVAAAEGKSEGGSDDTKKVLPLHPSPVDADQANRLFTVDELEHKMLQASVVMVEIQKQLYRGEEVYMEDTHAHGNLYRGWDAFIDLRDAGGSAGAAHQPGAHRRIPADHRWFSGSCKSVARSSRPQSRMSVTSTPSRSTSNTPVSTVPSPRSILSDASSSGGGAASAASSRAPPPPDIVAPAPAVVTVAAPPKPVPIPPSVPATTAAPVAVPQISTSPIQEKNKDVDKSEVAPASTALDAPETPVRRNTRKRKQEES